MISNELFGRPRGQASRCCSSWLFPLARHRAITVSVPVCLRRHLLKFDILEGIFSPSLAMRWLPKGNADLLEIIFSYFLILIAIFFRNRVPSVFAVFSHAPCASPKENARSFFMNIQLKHCLRYTYSIYCILH